MLKVHLRRGVKSCQLKFDRVKHESPYREILQQRSLDDESRELGSGVDEDVQGETAADEDYDDGIDEDDGDLNE